MLEGPNEFTTGALRPINRSNTLHYLAQYVPERMVIMTITVAVAVAATLIAIYIQLTKVSYNAALAKLQCTMRFQAMTPGVTVVNRDCGVYPAIEDEEIVDITDEVEIISDDTDAIVDKLLESLGDVDSEIEEIEAAQRELRSRLIAVRSRREMFKRLSN